MKKIASPSRRASSYTAFTGAMAGASGCGGVLTGFMALLFQAIGIDPETFLMTWLVPCGAAGAVIVGSWLVEAKLGAQLSLRQRSGLRRQCATAKERLLADPKLEIIHAYKAQQSVYSALVSKDGHIVKLWPGYSSDMMQEMNKLMAEEVGEPARAFDTQYAPKEKTSGCYFEQ